MDHKEVVEKWHTRQNKIASMIAGEGDANCEIKDGDFGYFDFSGKHKPRIFLERNGFIQAYCGCMENNCVVAPRNEIPGNFGRDVNKERKGYFVVGNLASI